MRGGGNSGFPIRRFDSIVVGIFLEVWPLAWFFSSLVTLMNSSVPFEQILLYPIRQTQLRSLAAKIHDKLFLYIPWKIELHRPLFIILDRLITASQSILETKSQFAQLVSGIYKYLVFTEHWLSTKLWAKYYGKYVWVPAMCYVSHWGLGYLKSREKPTGHHPPRADSPPGKAGRNWGTTLGTVKLPLW